MPLDKRDIARLLRDGSPRLPFRKKDDGKSKVWAKFDMVACNGVPVPFVIRNDCRVVYANSGKDGTSSLVSHKCGLKSADSGQSSIAGFCRPATSESDYTVAKRTVTEAAVACAVKDLRRDYSCFAGIDIAAEGTGTGDASPSSEF